MSFNQNNRNPYMRPNTHLYVPIATEERIIVERHFIPATIYRDLYSIPKICSSIY